MDHTTRHTLTRLGAAYALAWATTSMAVGPGSAALVRLSGNLAFAGLYVLATATVGVLLMKESKRMGRALLPAVTEP